MRSLLLCIPGLVAWSAACLDPGASATPDAPDAAVWPTTAAVKAAPSPGEFAVYTDRSVPLIGRIAPGLVDQPQRQRVLLFGGWNVDTGVQADTWEWDGFGWIRRIPSNDPGPRFSPGVAFDEVGQRVLLFGGLASFAPTIRAVDDRVWEWNGTNWYPIVTAHVPALRASPAMAYDVAQKRTLMFGGFLPSDGAGATPADDTLWAFDGTDWKQLPRTEPWPSPRGLAAMVVDRRTGHLILHGGVDKFDVADGNLNFLGQTTYQGDTWEWDGLVWKKLGATVPGFGIPALTSDVATGALTLFVDSLASSALYELVDDAWVVRQQRAADRLFSQGSWSTANQAVLVTGGAGRNASGAPSSSSAKGEYLVSTTLPWTRLPEATQPTPRTFSASSLVRGTGHALLAGGLNSAQVLIADSWLWNGGGWSLLPPADPAPPPRAAHAMAPLGDDSVLLFGGYDLATPFSDTWIWKESDNTWTEVMGPGPSARIAMGASALGDGVVVFGGSNGTTTLNDTWIFERSTGWRQITPPVSPPGRPFGWMGPSLDGRSVRLFGGSMPDVEVSFGDLWSFDGSTWAQLGNLAPLTRRRTPLVADVALGRQYMLSGLGAAQLADSWDLTGNEAVYLDVRVVEDHQGLPVRRNWHTAFPNPLGGGVVMTGGVANESGNFLPDTWQLKTFGAACTQSSECSAGQACTEGACCEASTCGPCRTCAAPGSRGMCAPRGTFGPEPGCDGPGQACTVQGLCRLANEQACSDNTMCASGTCLTAGRDAGVCCAAEGCAVRCVGNGLQGPDGTTVDCAPYACEANRCKASCKSIEDCTGGSVCNDQGACVLPSATAASDGCSCRIGAGTTNVGGLGAALAALAMLRRRRAPLQRPGPGGTNAV